MGYRVVDIFSQLSKTKKQKLITMSITLKNFKKKHPNFKCLSVTNCAKYVAGEFTCKSALKASYSYKSGKVFDNPNWNISHGTALQETIIYLQKKYPGIELFDRESITLRGKIGNTNIFGSPDLVGRLDDELIIADAKSGASRYFHKFQIAIYSEMLSLKLNLKVSNMILSYYDPSLKSNNFNIVSLGSHEDIKNILNDGVKGKLLNLSDLIVSNEEAAPSPTETNCKFCDWKGSCNAVFNESNLVVNLFADIKA